MSRSAISAATREAYVMVAAGSFGDIFGSIDFWRGVGRLLVDSALVYSLLVVVLAISGPLTPLFSGTRRNRQPQPADTPHVQQASGTVRKRASSSEWHLEYLDQLRTALKYQGSTVVLIVFAVILLGFQRVLVGSEVATILSGIAGFVLGQTKSSTPNAVETTAPATNGQPSAGPTNISFTPKSGAVGTTVTIAGQNLSSAAEAAFNGTPAIITSNTATEIVTTVPARATTGPISVTTREDWRRASSLSM